MTRFFTESRPATVQQPNNITAPRFHNHPSPVYATTRTHESCQTGRSYQYNDGGVQMGVSHIATANNRQFFTRETNYDTNTGHTTGATHYASYTHTCTQERSVLIKFEAEYENLYCDSLLGHDFLVNNKVSWDYAACTIHMGRQIRTSTCWKGKL